MPRRKKELHYYLAGFTDAEGCFSVALKRQKTARFSWVLDPVFHVTQHEINRHILEIFRRSINCGRIIEKHGQINTLQFIVDNRRQLAEKVIPFFERYDLLAKGNDFHLFKEIVMGLERKDHSRIVSFRPLVIKAFQMNMEGKQRRYKLEDVLQDLNKYDSGSSEAIRQTSVETPE